MRLPRDLSGEKVAQLLARHYSYELSRTKGGHMTVTATNQNGAHHSVTVPRHSSDCPADRTNPASRA